MQDSWKIMHEGKFDINRRNQDDYRQKNNRKGNIGDKT